MVRSSFADGIRVQLPNVLKWTSLSDEIRGFFTVFRMDAPALASVKVLHETEFLVYEKHM